MLQLHDGMALYHGSSVPVEQPDLSKCSPRKDFGRGFYLTTSVEQARDFARIVTRRAARESSDRLAHLCAYVSRYEFRFDPALRIVTYETADADWLHCIVAHRQGAPFDELARKLADMDVIVGKVANDQTNATIIAYLAGVYGETGSASADELCIGLLLPERLQDQACFRSQKAIGCLVYRDCEELCL